MNIALISPYLTVQPYGLRILSSVLRQAGFKTKMIFLPKERHFFRGGYREEIYSEKTLSMLSDIVSDCSLAGISVMTPYFQKAVSVTQYLKNKHDIKILWGGVHPTACPEESLKYADIVSLGEGDRSIVELAHKIADGSNDLSVDGMWTKKDGQINKNPPAGLVQDLDSLPFQDFDNPDQYILDEIDGETIIKMDSLMLKKYMYGSYNTMASRGCPFSCAYCCNSMYNRLYNGQKVLRHRSVDNLLKELIPARQIYAPDMIGLEDDAFFTRSEDDIEYFSRRYKEEIGLPFLIAGAAPQSVTERKIKALSEAGMKVVRIGIQTGSENEKKIYNRTVSNDLIEEKTKLLKSFRPKIKIWYDIITDNPWATDEDYRKTIRFLTEIPRADHVNLFSLRFYPGTELAERARKDNIPSKNPNYNDLEGSYFNMILKFVTDLYLPKGLVRFLIDEKVMRYKLYVPVILFLKIMIVFKEIGKMIYWGLKDIRSFNFKRIYLFFREFFARTASEA